MSKLEVSSEALEPKRFAGMIKSLVVPRPIAWVSTVSADGVDNLAPHSYFNMVSNDPAHVVFSSTGEKDTLRNVRATGEFVVLLGASVSAATLMAIGPGLMAVTVVGVVVGIAISYGLGRLFRLPRRMAVLIACGNGICGNSAIAAVAPVIDADAKDVSAAIAFTAVLGVVVVLTLPLLGLALGIIGPLGNL